MSDINNGKLPINPIFNNQGLSSKVYSERQEYNISGLNKREYFAGLAMQGFLSDPKATEWGSQIVAATAVEMADALLEALADE